MLEAGLDREAQGGLELYEVMRKKLNEMIREIAAIAELQKIYQSDAFAKATVEAGKGSCKAPSI